MLHIELVNGLLELIPFGLRNVERRFYFPSFAWHFRNGVSTAIDTTELWSAEHHPQG